MIKRRFQFEKTIVLTPVGCAFLVISVIIMVRSLLTRNFYEILLSFTALFLLLILGITGVWKSKKLKSLEPGWKLPYPMTANAGENSLVSGLDVNIPMFFRLHFIVRGRFFPAGGKGCSVFAETSVSRGEKATSLPLDFPMSGKFLGKGFCRLKDIFGFFSFPCGIILQRTVNVRSTPCFGKDHLVKAQTGAEDRRNKFSTDEERYYMREYTPGDRFRDINWKSSEKIDALITRISPDNQEKVSRIEVCFRNYMSPVKAGKPNQPSLEALWLLDRAKARLSHFLRNLMEQQSAFIFTVRAGEYNWEIDDQESLDVFLDELAGLSFSSPKNEKISANASVGELYVFSTACDLALPGFLLACHPRPVSLYMVQPDKKLPEKTETLYKRDFLKKGFIINPRWFIKSKIKQLGVNTGRVENNYAGTRI